MEPEYREWQAQLDGYINQWSAEVRKFIEDRRQRKPHDDRQP
jgi:hypothetical protein